MQYRDAVAERKLDKLPWHSPPHLGEEPRLYHITAACFHHEQIITSAERRTAFELSLIGGLSEQPWADVRAWCILPHHYHMLALLHLPSFAKWVGRLHNTTSTKWNGEDKKRGRRVWYRFADRYIRGEIHYFRTLNYIHANPVLHGFVEKTQDWRWSSFQVYAEKHGRETLVEWWREYPTDGYGKGWDEF